MWVCWWASGNGRVWLKLCLYYDEAFFYLLDLDDTDCPPPAYPGLDSNKINQHAHDPAFDDSIYSTPQSDCELINKL